MVYSAFLTIGKVIKAHGQKGELGVKNYASSPFLFGELSRIYIKGESKFPKKYLIQNYRLHQKYVILQLEGIEDRTRVQELIGNDIWIRKRDLPPKDEDEEIFLFELEGCSVYLPEKEYIGVLKQARQEAAQEIWSIQGIDGKEILFPVAGEFIQDINIESGEIIISPPPGLLELYKSE